MGRCPMIKHGQWQAVDTAKCCWALCPEMLCQSNSLYKRKRRQVINNNKRGFFKFLPGLQKLAYKHIIEQCRYLTFVILHKSYNIYLFIQELYFYIDILYYIFCNNFYLAVQAPPPHWGLSNKQTNKVREHDS